MQHLLRGMRRVILVAALALAGLADTLSAAPAALAAGPALQVTGQGGNAYVHGSGFTPGVTVRVELLNSSLTILASTQYLTPTSGYGGGWFATVLPASFTGGAWVLADQAGWPTTGAQTWIYPDPSITASAQTGPSSTTFVVSGSGYTPGAAVTVKACAYADLACAAPLATQTVSASVATWYNADYGLIYAGALTVPAHSGWVWVYTTGGAPAPSNSAWFLIA